MVRRMNVFIFVVFVLGMLLLVLPWLFPRPGLDGVIPDLPFADSRFMEIDGVRMHWRERLPAQADGERLVVLLHGYGGSGFSWRHTLDALEAAGFPVIAPDVPPFGYSERTAAGPVWSELVVAVADQVKPEAQLILVGHSMGAGVAADIAAMAPDRVAKIIMIDGTPELRRGSGRMSWLMAIPSFARAAEVYAAWKIVNEKNISNMLASAFGRAPSREELSGYYRPLTIPGTYPALIRRTAQRTPLEDSWTATPTRLIWGENDQWVPRSRADALVDAYPEFGPVITIAGAGHNPMDTHPDALDRLILELIRSSGR